MTWDTPKLAQNYKNTISYRKKNTAKPQIENRHKNTKKAYRRSKTTRKTSKNSRKITNKFLIYFWRWKLIFSKIDHYLHNYAKITLLGCKTGPKNPIRPLKLVVRQRISGVPSTGLKDHVIGPQIGPWQLQPWAKQFLKFIWA